jgi:hypothetical protein
MLIKNKSAALAVLALIVLGTVGLWLPNNEYHQRTIEHKQYDSSIYDDLPSGFSFLTKWAAENHDALEALSALSTVFLTVALAIFTGVLAKKTSGLYDETAHLRRVAVQQGNDLVRSIEAAEKSALATQQISNSNRARIVFDQIIFWDNIGDSTIDGVHFDRGLGLKVQWVNSGETPSLSTDCYITHHIVDRSDISAPIFKPDFSGSRGSATIGPSRSFSSPLRVVVDDDRQRFLDHASDVIIYSCVRYLDIHTTTTRTSESCIRIIFHGYARDKDGNIVANRSTMPVGPQNRST